MKTNMIEPDQVPIHKLHPLQYQATSYSPIIPLDHF